MDKQKQEQQEEEEAMFQVAMEESLGEVGTRPKSQRYKPSTLALENSELFNYTLLRADRKDKTIDDQAILDEMEVEFAESQQGGGEREHQLTCGSKEMCQDKMSYESEAGGGQQQVEQGEGQVDNSQVGGDEDLQHGLMACGSASATKVSGGQGEEKVAREVAKSCEEVDGEANAQAEPAGLEVEGERAKGRGGVDLHQAGVLADVQAHDMASHCAQGGEGTQGQVQPEDQGVWVSHPWMRRLPPPYSAEMTIDQEYLSQPFCPWCYFPNRFFKTEAEKLLHCRQCKEPDFYNEECPSKMRCNNSDPIHWKKFEH